MKIAVGLLTYNIFATQRDKMFEDSLKVIKDEFKDVLIYTHGSTDGTGQLVESLGGVWSKAINPDFSTRYSTGYRALGTLLCAKSPDIVFITADDVVYKPSIAAAMENWWVNAPKEVAITSWFLEPSYPWNFLIEKVEYAGIRGYSRASVPGCSWNFRVGDWKAISKRPGFEDIGTCQDLIKAGRKVIQIDWGDHVGEKNSAWGNPSWKQAVPFNPEEEDVQNSSV